MRGSYERAFVRNRSVSPAVAGEALLEFRSFIIDYIERKVILYIIIKSTLFFIKTTIKVLIIYIKKL